MAKKMKKAKPIDSGPCEVCGKEGPRYVAPNGQKACATDLAGLIILDRAIRNLG